MINKINSITNRKIVDNFNDIEAVINYVRDNQRPEYKYIEKARSFGKGTDEYDTLKRNKIPCAIINFEHDKYVKRSTLLKPTGYMYLDIDDECDLDFDLNYVHAYWRSLSNNGYSVVLKVKGLNDNHLKESYRYVGDLLDVGYDKAAISKDRVTVLSYDPNAYFNNDSVVIDLSSIEFTQHSNKKSFYLGYDCDGDKIRLDNREEVIIEKGIVLNYNEDGLFDLGKNNKLEFSEVKVPFKPIHKGRREKVMSSIAHQLITLNKSCPKSRLFALINVINKDKMIPPLDINEINSIVNKKYRNRHNLTPLINASRRFFYNPEYSLNATQKRRLTIKKINRDRIEMSKMKITKTLTNWDYKKHGKITIKGVASISNMDRKTVQKYYSELIEKLNISKTKQIQCK